MKKSGEHSGLLNKRISPVPRKRWGLKDPRGFRRRQKRKSLIYIEEKRVDELCHRGAWILRKFKATRAKFTTASSRRGGLFLRVLGAPLGRCNRYTLAASRIVFCLTKIFLTFASLPFRPRSIALIFLLAHRKTYIPAYIHRA